MNTSGLTRGGALTIPADVAWPIGEALAKDGSVRRGYLGVRTQSVELPVSKTAASSSGPDRGVLVVWLEDGGPAASAGILVGDIITSIGGKAVLDPDDIFAALTTSTVGKPTDVAVLRGGTPQKIRVVVGERK